MVSTRRAGGGSGPQSVPGGPAKNAAPDGSNGGGKSVNAESFLALLAAKLQAQGKRDWQVRNSKIGQELAWGSPTNATACDGARAPRPQSESLRCCSAGAQGGCSPEAGRGHLASWKLPEGPPGAGLGAECEQTAA